MLSIENKHLSDIDCGREYCGFCQVDKVPRLTLRGQLGQLTAQVDREFVCTQEFVNGKYIFQGVQYNAILFDNLTGAWNISSLAGNQTILQTVKSPDYPLGQHLWQDGAGQTYTLNLDTCRPDQFNCNDGGCTAFRDANL